jgi:hypothetical protein
MENRYRVETDILTFVNSNVSEDKQIHFFNESAVKLSDVILDRMFDSMVDRYNRIDFEDIPNSKGDITKFKYYKIMEECIQTMKEISQTTDHIPEVAILSESVENIKMLKKVFEDGFRTKNAYVIILYNIMVMAVFECTSVLIASVIDFIKQDEGYELSVVKYKSSKKMLIINSLSKFNESVKDGSLIKYIEKTTEPIPEIQSQAMTESAILGLTGIKIGGVLYKVAVIAAALWLGLRIIPLLRELVYLFYNMKQRISDIARIQAEFLEANITVLRNRGDDQRTAKVITKQERVVEWLMNLSRKFAVTYDSSEKQTKMQLDRERYDVGDVII